jgi:CheY-like chemotaxis protein
MPAVDPAAKTILVVEDADAIRHLVCSTLSHNGYQCLEASDGLEALQLLERVGRLDLVLTDIIMPRMNGREFAEHAARLKPQLPLMFMSGYADDPAVRFIEDNPPALFLAKPFTATALIEKVRLALGST